MNYKIKRVLVTGAAQGIGYAIAERLAKDSIPVIISDINEEAAFSAASQLKEKYDVDVIGVKMNVADKCEVNQVISYLYGKYGVIDGLVNNAGICYPAKPIGEITENEWNSVFSVNVIGIANCTAALVEIMKTNGYGKIVNMTSSSGFTGGISVSASYAVSKAGVMALTKNMAKQYGCNRITVNAVSPGIISTEMTKNLPYDMSVLALRRFGEREEVADVVAFLLSEESSYLTGNIIDINGGLYMR